MTPFARLRLPLFVLLASGLAAFAEPVLLVKREGQAVPVSEVPGWRPGLGTDSFQLKVELNELDGLACWWPKYTLRHSSGSQRDRWPEVDARLSLVLDLLELVDMEGKQKGSELAALWPQAEVKDGLLLVAWVRDGQVSKVFPAAPAGMREGAITRLQVNANMSEQDLGGYPVLLFWSQGRFLPVNEHGVPAELAPAFRAAVKDDAETLRRLLGEGLAVGACDLEGKSLAEHAAGSGALKVLAVLKANKAKLKEPSKTPELRPGPAGAAASKRYNLSPLELASTRGRTDVVRFLVASGVSPSGRAQEFDSPLYCAAVNGHLETVKALIEHKAKINEVTHHNITCVIGAINEDYPDVADLLLTNGADFEFLTENNRKAFLSICRDGKFSMARFYVEHGNDVKRPVDGYYPLVEAAVKGSASFAEYLLKCGASPNVQDDNQRTPLLAACTAGNEDFAKLLLAAGAKVDVAGKSGTTPLHAAIYRQKYELVKMLLAAGAPTGVKNRNGLTPLDMAVIIGAWECVDPFLKAGGRLDPKSPLLNEELQSILRGDQVDLLAQLLQAGVPAEHPVSGAWTLLRLAELAKAKRCALLLREAGASSDETKPVSVVKANSLDAGFKLLSGKPPFDPRPDEMASKGASMTVRVLVDYTGRVCFTMIDECADPLLCVGLSDTVESWRFTPPTLGGAPVAVWVAQPVKFPSLKERNAAKPKADVMPRPIKQSPPVYPFSARVRGATAEVMLSFVVDEKGDVRNARVVRTSGEEFNQPALDCLKKWKFKPGTAKGVPVPVELTVPIIFSISG